jgi:dihydropteroate synthase
VWGVRVHNVAATRVAIDTVSAWQNGADLREQGAEQ